MKIVPALLALDEDDYRRKLDLVASFTDFVQIDFMDGSFVPSRSVTASAAGAIPVPLDWEAHLMVGDPPSWLDCLAGPRLRRVIFHCEAVADPAAVARRILASGFAPGVALNPETPPQAALPFLPLLESVLVMSVNPGFYGSPFIPETLGKAAPLKAARPSLVVGLDGGVGADNLMQARDAGFDYACVGSRIFQAEDPAASFARLSGLAN